MRIANLIHRVQRHHVQKWIAYEVMNKNVKKNIQTHRFLLDIHTKAAKWRSKKNKEN
jgi:hypothetical protein